MTKISRFFVHDIGFPRKRGRVGGLPNDDASTHFGGRTRGGRLAGWRAAGLRLAGRLAGDKLAASGERANSGRRQPGRRKTVERGKLRAQRVVLHAREPAAVSVQSGHRLPPAENFTLLLKHALPASSRRMDCKVRFFLLKW